MPVKTAAAPETRERDALRLTGRTPFSGATVANLSPAVADELSLDLESSGVVITDVEQRTPAAQVGFQKGDIILAVNNQKIESSRDLEKLTRERAGFWQITLNRGGQVFTSMFGG